MAAVAAAAATAAAATVPLSLSSVLHRQGTYMVSPEHGLCDMDDEACQRKHFPDTSPTCRKNLQRTMSRAGIERRKALMLNQKNMLEKPESGGKRKPPPPIPSEPELYDPSSSAVKCEVIDGDSSFPEGSSSSRKKEE